MNYRPQQIIDNTNIWGIRNGDSFSLVSYPDPTHAHQQRGYEYILNKLRYVDPSIPLIITRHVNLAIERFRLHRREDLKFFIQHDYRMYVKVSPGSCENRIKFIKGEYAQHYAIHCDNDLDIENVTCFECIDLDYARFQGIERFVPFAVEDHLGLFDIHG